MIDLTYMNFSFSYTFILVFSLCNSLFFYDAVVIFLLLVIGLLNPSRGCQFEDMYKFLKSFLKFETFLLINFWRKAHIFLTIN